MRRWDGLVEKYVALQETRGLSAETVRYRQRELHRLGAWLKTRRPRLNRPGFPGGSEEREARDARIHGAS